MYIFDSTANSTYALGGVYFNNAPEWVDRFKGSQKTGSVHRLIGGDAVIQTFDKHLKGQPITLKLDGKRGVISASRAASLIALRDAGNAVTFTPDSGTTNISVVFDPSKENPIDLEYLPGDDNEILLQGTIYLLRA